MTLDGKSDDYGEKLFGGEKKHTPSANLSYLPNLLNSYLK